MSNFALASDEVILYEDNNQCDLYKGTVHTTITSKRIIFEKEKGIFKKEMELLDMFLLSDIKTLNDVPQVSKKGSDIFIQTVQGNMTISFSGMIEASKIHGKLINILTDSSLATRSSDKIKDAFNLVDDTLKLDTRATIKGVIENGVTGTLLKGIKKK